MKIVELRKLLNNKEVIEEINKHLWIESQKIGYSIGIERATDEWLSLHALSWMKYNMPEKYEKMMSKKKSSAVAKKNVKITKKKVVVKKNKKAQEKSKRSVKKVKKIVK